MSDDATIVDDVRADVVRRNDIAPQNVDYISRRVNRKRQQMRPEDPRGMNFEVMRLPFIMLLTIHAFVRRGDCSKQVPLVYVMMTGKSAKDYASVLRGIVQLLGGNICLEGVVLDYERAIWKALRVVFQDRQISFQGCAFHWGQAVWRHVQSLGLASQYLSDAGTRCFIRKLLSLPFIPAEHIEPTFDALRSFNSSDNIEPLLDYVHTNWIQSSFWPIQCWCVYGQSVRTNNDVEGWHNRLNSRAGVAPAFYNLVRKLREESTFVEQQVTLVSEMRLKKIQRMSYRSTQARLFAAWDSYRSGEISTTGLLKKVSNIYTPRLKRHEEDEEDKE